MLSIKLHVSQTNSENSYEPRHHCFQIFWKFRVIVGCGGHWPDSKGQLTVKSASQLRINNLIDTTNLCVHREWSLVWD